MSSSIREGWIDYKVQEFGFHVYKQFYCVLNGPTMYIFEDGQKSRLKQTIALPNLSTVVVRDSKRFHQSNPSLKPIDILSHLLYKPQNQLGVSFNVLRFNS